MGTLEQISARGITQIVVENAFAALVRLDSSTIDLTFPSSDPIADGWTYKVKRRRLIVTAPDPKARRQADPTSSLARQGWVKVVSPYGIELVNDYKE